MKTLRKNFFYFIIFLSLNTSAQELKLYSPDKNIALTINNDDTLSYSVTYKGREIVNTSQMGFEFKNEPPMAGGFAVTDQSVQTINESWRPVVKSKHSEIINNYNELILKLKEIKAPMRQMELHLRAYNDGTAFRYKLFRAAKVGDRQIVKELTTFAVPGDPKAWVVEYK